jgi:hypothetical protein
MPKELVVRHVEGSDETKQQVHTDVLVRWGGIGPQIEVCRTEWGADFYHGDLNAKPEGQTKVVSEPLAWHDMNELIKTLRKVRDQQFGSPA